jgi:cystathionine beta-synthase
MSREKISNLKAMGAKVVLTRSDVPKGHPAYYQDLAQKIATDMEGAFFVNQFGNPSNPKTHEEVTGPEIWEQMEHDLDAVVVGVGSSGTATGLSHFFQRVAPDLELILADPEGSILERYINDGVLSDESGSWLVEGIGEDFLPSISDFDHIRKAYAIGDRESMLTGRELLNKEGILAGSSTGTLVAAALKYCREQDRPKKVLTFAADTGNRYLSKMFNDFWMRDQGFIETDTHGDLRDLIARPFESNDTITVDPDEPLANAYGRMKLYDVSQLPVIKEQEIVGFIDESDILLAVAQSNDRFDKPVSSAMVTDLAVVDVHDSVDKLMPIFNKDFVAIVKDGNSFLGLITRVDLLNYLRRMVDH